MFFVVFASLWYTDAIPVVCEIGMRPTWAFFAIFINTKWRGFSTKSNINLIILLSILFFFVILLCVNIVMSCWIKGRIVDFIFKCLLRFYEYTKWNFIYVLQLKELVREAYWCVEAFKERVLPLRFPRNSLLHDYLIGSSRHYVVSHFCSLVISLFRTFVVSHFCCFALSLFCNFVVSFFCCFVLLLFRTFVVLQFRCFAVLHFRYFALSLFCTFVVSYFLRFVLFFLWTQFIFKGLQTAILPQVAFLFHTYKHTYIGLHSRCFVLSLFRTFVVSHFNVEVIMVW